MALAAEKIAAEQSLAEKRKMALQAVAIQSAQRVRAQREQEAIEIIKKEKQKQMLIVAGFGVAAVGVFAYGLMKK